MIEHWKKILCVFVGLFCFLQIAFGDFAIAFCASSVFVFFLILVIALDDRVRTLKFLSYFGLGLLLCIIMSIFFSVIFQSFNFFREYPFLRFLLGLEWAPNVQSKCLEWNCFGILSLLSGTMLITMVATMISVPVALFSAIYLSEYSNKELRKVASSLIEIFSGVPTIVYGYFALNFMSPAASSIAEFMKISIKSENALVAGAAVGLMILPSMISLMLEGLRGVQKIMRYGSFAIGATNFETTFRVILPTAFPAIMCSILLSVSRVIGETMIVLMTSGINSNFTFNPLESVTTITIQIVVLLTGEAEYSSMKVLVAYALTLFLFLFTFTLNLLAHLIVKKYNKKSLKV